MSKKKKTHCRVLMHEVSCVGQRDSIPTRGSKLHSPKLLAKIFLSHTFQCDVSLTAFPLHSSTLNPQNGVTTTTATTTATVRLDELHFALRGFFPTAFWLFGSAGAATVLFFRGTTARRAAVLCDTCCWYVTLCAFCD